MPSLPHEGLVLLFRHNPELAAQLARDTLHVNLPPFDHARIGEADLTQPVPATFTADLIILLERGPERKPVCALIVEPQLAPKLEKRRTWPHYTTGVRAKFGCDAVLLVVAIDEHVARWASEPIEIGHPGFCLTPLVLGPKDIPCIVDPAEARSAPELAILGIMAHGKHEDPERALEMATAAIAACHELEDDRALPYSELVFLSLGQVAKIALERLMAGAPFEYQSDFALKHRGEGRAEGKAEGKAASVLTVLRARGVAIADEQKARVLACRDLDQLDRWLERAVSVAAAEQLFAD
ncbi:hypothetical protein LVJ94_08315 [Pendulispora rubella]|uniref:Uncharacterized protein n=1 Tax=Pendulispora rubella TaxID=2741070 RepID=A0ABZ2L8H1_9BACT